MAKKNSPSKAEIALIDAEKAFGKARKALDKALLKVQKQNGTVSKKVESAPNETIVTAPVPAAAARVPATRRTPAPRVARASAPVTAPTRARAKSPAAAAPRVGTVLELRIRAKALGIPAYIKMNKAELVEAVGSN